MNTRADATAFAPGDRIGEAAHLIGHGARFVYQASWCLSEKVWTVELLQGGVWLPVEKSRTFRQAIGALKSRGCNLIYATVTFDVTNLPLRPSASSAVKKSSVKRRP